MKKLITTLLVITMALIVLPFLGGCNFETPESRRLRAQAELASAEAYKTQAEGEAYAVKAQANAEAYSIRRQADEEMVVTQQWVAERMALIREDQSNSLLMRSMVWVSFLAILSLPAQLGFAIWTYLQQKGKEGDSERRFYAAIIAMQRGRR